ncbi:hypothetical protein Tco_0653807 [Tanacetum coccineum]|uniref:Uncharacterized protein n=1 Tax=Tanacetum coccineum TaxID=301880 RepID=A0ABQ4X1F9_9ASTR
MTSKAQQIELDNALVGPENRRGQEFDKPPTEEEALSFIRELGHSGEIKYITDVIVDHLHQPWRTFASIINKCLYVKDLACQTDNMDSKKQDKMFNPRFTKIIIHHFLDKDKSISIRNRMFKHTAQDDSLLGTKRFVSGHADTQVYGAILPKAITNQSLLDLVAYKTYYAIALGAEPPKSRKSQNNSDSAISYEGYPSKKKLTKAKKVTAIKPKSTKKKAPVKADKGKGLNVLSEVALSEAAQLKEATKRSKKNFYISQANGSGDGTDFELGVPDEQHHKTSGINEGTGTIPRVPDVPKYDSESEKESWGDSGEEDEDDENDSKDKSNDGDDDDDDDGNDGNDGNDGDDDDDNQEGDDTNDDDEETDSDRTESNIIKIPVLNQSSTEYYEKEEEIDDEETMDDEEDDEVTKELYKDVNSGFEQEEEDAHVTLTPVLDTQKAEEPIQSSSVSSDFTSKLLNLENPSLANNEIASLMETSARHAMAVLEITSVFTSTISPPPPFFNPLLQQATPTPTPTTSEATTLFPSLLDFSYVFKFNDRVTNLEKDLSEVKQVDQYAQALSSNPAIVDCYIDNKLGETINKVIQAHNLDSRQEPHDGKNEYIGLVDTSMRTIIKEEVTTQLPRILPQVVYDFATPVIEKNVAESLETAVLKRSSSQLQSTYEAAAALSEFELTKILIDKMEKNKSYDKSAYERELYEALVKSYETDKDLFDSYGTKQRKSSKEVESSRDSRSKDKKSSSTSKDASYSQQKPSGKSTYTEDPSHIVDDSGVQQDQEFDTGNNDEQPVDKEVSKADWFKKPERPPTPDSDWNKRQHVDFRPPQTWISQVARAKEPRTSFDEFIRLLCICTEILVGPAFELLKSTYKSLTKLEYHLEECSKATTERLDGITLKANLSLIQDHRGCQVIPQDFFINNDLKYLQGGDLSKWKRIIVVTKLTIMKKYDYGHLEEIEVRREDQKLYKFKEGDFPRLRLQDIEDMLLLLVQKKLTNLTINERNDLNVALRMFTRWIVIQRLMRADELHKFNDGILTDVRSALNDIAKGIRIEYLPKRKWSGLDKRRAWVMV